MNDEKNAKDTKKSKSYLETDTEYKEGYLETDTKQFKEFNIQIG